MRLLPKQMKEKVIFDHLDSSNDNPEKLKDWARETVKKWNVWKLGDGVNMLDHENAKNEDDELFQAEIMNLMSQDLEDEELLAAVTAVRRSWRKGKGKGKGRSSYTIRCVNCGKEGHMASQCPQPGRDTQVQPSDQAVSHGNLLRWGHCSPYGKMLTCIAGWGCGRWRAES